MEYLARKITRSKWAKEAEGMRPGDIRADAITGCLRTSGDALSVWECDDDPADVAETILALAAAGNQIAKMDVVLLGKEQLLTANISVRSTPERALTPVGDLRQRHVDIVRVDMSRLCAISAAIAARVRSDAHCYQLSRKEVAGLIYEAVVNRRVSRGSLHPDLVDEVETILKTAMPAI
jgi:hypothetical protein